MNAYRHRWFGLAGPTAGISDPAAIDAFLVAAPDMDLSRVGIATAMAFQSLLHRDAAPIPAPERS